MSPQNPRFQQNMSLEAVADIRRRGTPGAATKGPPMPIEIRSIAPKDKTWLSR